MPVVLTAHQSLYLPWLGFFQKVSMSDKFCLWDDVQFDPNDYQQRNRLKNANGAFLITVPIISKGDRTKKIKDMRIENQHNWRRIHKNAILFSYSKSPYFESYSDFFKSVYEKNWDVLVDLNTYLLKYFLKELGMDVEIILASEQSFEGTKSARIIDMCNKMGADTYIFGALGKDYADMDAFQKAGITPYFQKYEHPVYPQQWGEFIPYLSVIDLLFNCGEKSFDTLKRGNPTRRRFD